MVTSSLSLGLALLGGLLTVFSPCILPVLPIDCGAIASVSSAMAPSPLC